MLGNVLRFWGIKKSFPSQRSVCGSTVILFVINEINAMGFAFRIDATCYLVTPSYYTVQCAVLPQPIFILLYSACISLATASLESYVGSVNTCDEFFPIQKWRSYSRASLCSSL